MGLNEDTNFVENINDDFLIRDLNTYKTKDFYKEKIFVNNSLLLLKICLFLLEI